MFQPEVSGGVLNPGLVALPLLASKIVGQNGAHLHHNQQSRTAPNGASVVGLCGRRGTLLCEGGASLSAAA